MQKFEEIGLQIVDFLNHPEQLLRRLIGDPRAGRFVVCGTSGSGKSRAIERANSLLALHRQIAESHDLLREKELSNALKIVEDEELRYEASEYIGFSIIGTALANKLEEDGVKVFWLDNGSSHFR